MEFKFSILVVVWCGMFGIVAGGGCGSDDETDTPATRPENTGAACAVAADCFPDVNPDDLQGEVRCLDRVRDGYCTHLCESDDNCCAADGECPKTLRQVCSPFESTNEQMCFLSCEVEDIPPAEGDAEPMDENEFCQVEAGTEFICRSSGGGSDNRKVCVPGSCGMGAACDTDADCTGGLTCLTEFNGGYCGTAGCAADADCPEDSACVAHPNGTNYCFATCETNADCSFCRFDGSQEACTPDVDLVEGGDRSVCPPPSA